MGDGLDGWGSSLDGLVIIIVFGTPIALVLLIFLSINSHVRLKHSPNRIRVRNTIICGILGILFGMITGLISISTIADASDECRFLDKQSRRGMYTDKERAAKLKKMQIMKCPDIVQEYSKSFGDLKVRSIAITAPSLGLVTSFIITSIVMRRMRK
jgi:hypothetical protein